LLRRLQRPSSATAAVPHQSKSDLTARETEVLKLVAKGFSCAEISSALGTSVHTTTSHNEQPRSLLRDCSFREAIHDLRLMIDSLDPTEGDLRAVLGMFRDRLEPRLAAAGLRFEWRVQDVLPLSELGAQRVLQILRILQEAIQNVLKHAHARAVRVSTGEVIHPTLGNVLYIEIYDDGRGFSGAIPSGSGLANMRDRAQQLDGLCEVQSDQNGTTVRLYIRLG
jgi:nitrate/nitrite-specific signal transduction histidine kinase